MFDEDNYARVLTDANGVAVIGKHLLHAKVADDDVGLFFDQAVLVLVLSHVEVRNGNIQAKAVQDGFCVLANDASVASNTNLVGLLRDSAAHKDDLSIIALDGGCEGSV